MKYIVKSVLEEYRDADLKNSHMIEAIADRIIWEVGKHITMSNNSSVFDNIVDDENSWSLSKTERWAIHEAN